MSADELLDEIQSTLLNVFDELKIHHRQGEYWSAAAAKRLEDLLGHIAEYKQAQETAGI